MTSSWAYWKIKLDTTFESWWAGRGERERERESSIEISPKNHTIVFNNPIKKKGKKEISEIHISW